MTENSAPLRPVHVIGGGLAGSEAAWQIARTGVPVVLHEMRPQRATEAHKTGFCAELVCSNSFRSDDATGNAVGVLHREMRAMGSLIMAQADAHKVPAGGALAVDRDGFAASVTQALESEPLITIDPRRDGRAAARGLGQCHHRQRPADLARALAEAIGKLTGEAELAFFDAIAPIVHRRVDRHGQGLVPVALRQGGTGRNRRRLHQLPARPRPI